MQRASRPTRWPHLLGVAALILLAAGCDSIEPGAFTPVEKAAFVPSQTAVARVSESQQWFEAVGTVRPKTETRIEAQVSGQVLDVQVSPGDAVTKGALLVTLDSRQMTSRLDQARQAEKGARAGREQARHSLEAAKAGFKQAEANYRRVKTYFASQAATAEQLEAAESAFSQAQAAVKRAEEGLAAAQSGLLQAQGVVKESAIATEYSRILAPEDGVVLKRFVEPGDLALPGKPLVALRTTGALRIEAHVREGLISRVTLGTVLQVGLDTLDQSVEARVEEVVPYADPASRTFLVKAALPAIDGLFPGMFAKLRVPVGHRPVVTVPAAAIRRVGQLELVRVKNGEQWQTRYVTTGARSGDQVEVLSGLAGNETIGWEDANHG